MSEIKLAKCPFCDVELKRWDYMPNVFFEHPYNGCILSGKKVLESEHDINAWNTRKPMERILTRLEEMTTSYNPYDSYYEENEYRATKFENVIRNKTIKEIKKVIKEEGGIE